MRISSERLETQIELDVSRPFLLCIESPKEYFNTVNELMNAFAGNISEYTFWDGDKQINAEKEGELLTDMFSFGLSDKKIINLLYKRLQSNFNNGQLIFEFQKLRSVSEHFLSNLCETEDFALTYSEMTFDALLKAVSIRPEENYETLLEKVICYINLFIELKNIRFLAFVGLKSVLSDEDLRLLYRHSKLHKLSLLLVECGKIRPLLEEEKVIIITEDLCEIVENFG